MARKKLDTLTEQMYYVLLSLTEERHGYGIMQYVSELTRGRVAIGAGTLYALLGRFEKEGLIRRGSVQGDARLKSLIPTQKAIELDAQVNGCLRRAEQCLTQGLTEAQLAAFKEAAAQMSANLDA